MSEVEVRPLVSYICAHKVQHDGREYAAGEEFRSSDPKVIEALRQAKAILLPTEVQSAESVAARQAALEAELAAAREELEALRQAHQASAASSAVSGGKRGGSKSDAPEA